MKWRYSLRWKLPSPCPGPHELASEVVEAGQPAPESIMSRWVAGAGYAVCVDFPDERQIKRWSDERKAAARRRKPGCTPPQSRSFTFPFLYWKVRR